jgi:hypothetical protein
MKKNLLLCCALMALFLGAQAQKFRGADNSAMDMAYYPDDFAHDRKFAPAKVGDKAFIRVIYSRPSKNGREVFGKLIPYGKVWRMGANEAAEVKFYQDVTIQVKLVKAGTYALFAIPSENEWTIILNTELDHWGAYSYNQANDILRVTTPVKKSEEAIDLFSLQFSKSSEKEAIMRIGWETTIIELPISF